MNENEQVGAALLERVDMLIRLVAHQVALAHETLEMKAVVLSSLGLKPADIAKICGTTAGTVSVRLAEAKKKARAKASKRK
jgi:DNA-directed RNA polymerase specialized sigma24 family protein